ncbi:hypothetical protein ACS0TY_017786 [Phlomoides rotata]
MEEGQTESDSIIDLDVETSRENSRDSSETKLGTPVEREEQEKEARRNRRKKSKRKSKRKCAVISREELRWFWYDDCEETKMEEVNKRACKSIWGNSSFDWAWHGATGNLGGILTIWNSEVFQKTSDWSREGMLVVNGRWVEDRTEYMIVNIYGPNSGAQRKELWETLQALVWQNGLEAIYIIGDFNTTREESDRVGRANSWDRNKKDKFNNFIEGCDLTEIQLVGRRYTWYRPDGTCESKLDRMLVNTNWLNKWPGEILRGGKRSLSDHVPIYIEGCKKDWGPRPLKNFNQWIQHLGYKGLIERVWSTSLKQGWTSFVIKEKLKEVKAELKVWSKEVFQGMDRKIELKKEEIEILDILDDTFGLEDEEMRIR